MKNIHLIIAAILTAAISIAGDYPLVWVNNAQTGKQDRTLNGKTIYADVSSVRGHLSTYSSHRAAEPKGGIASLSNYTYVRRPGFTGYSARRQSQIDSKASIAKMTNESTARQAHIQSIVPAGGHPAAGSNKQIQYNNNGSFAGAAQSRYSSGSHIFQATDRYSQTVLHKSSSGAITAYMLGGQGILVLGSPYTDAFTVSGFSSWYTPPTAPPNFLALSASIAHSVDPQTLINGSTILFRNFTSFSPEGGLTFIARRIPHPPVNVRMVVTNQVRDINGNYMFTTYSSAFVRYSSL